VAIARLGGHGTVELSGGKLGFPSLYFLNAPTLSLLSTNTFVFLPLASVRGQQV